jgi:hypothetical protein
MAAHDGFGSCGGNGMLVFEALDFSSETSAGTLRSRLGRLAARPIGINFA